MSGLGAVLSSCKIKAKEQIVSCLTEALYNYFAHGITKPFDDWHKDVCDEISEIFKAHTGCDVFRIYVNRNLSANKTSPLFANVTKRDIMHSAKLKTMCSAEAFFDFRGIFYKALSRLNTLQMLLMR